MHVAGDTEGDDLRRLCGGCAGRLAAPVRVQSHRLPPRNLLPLLPALICSCQLLQQAAIDTEPNYDELSDVSGLSGRRRGCAVARPVVYLMRRYNLMKDKRVMLQRLRCDRAGLPENGDASRQLSSHRRYIGSNGGELRTCRNKGIIADRGSPFFRCQVARQPLAGSSGEINWMPEPSLERYAAVAERPRRSWEARSQPVGDGE